MNSLPWFDAHCHLAAPQTVVGDMPMNCCGTSPEDWGTVHGWADENPSVIPAYGIHPWIVETIDSEEPAPLRELEGLLTADPRAAVGEIGLDFAKCEKEARPRQVDVFQKQLLLAKQHRRVAVIHCVQAWGALQDVLTEVGPLPCDFVLHAYAGSAEMVVPLMRLGAFFSFKAACKPLSSKMVARIQAVPAERVLLESDLHLGRDGADADVQREKLQCAAAEIAEARGMTVSDVARLTAQNAKRCFCGT